MSQIPPADAPSPAPAHRSQEPVAANENCLLAELHFLCARTNRSIGTGVWTDNKALALAQAQGATMCLKCPHCGMTHRPAMREAMLMRTLRREDGVPWEQVASLPAVDAGHAVSPQAKNAHTSYDADARISPRYR